MTAGASLLDRGRLLLADYGIVVLVGLVLAVGAGGWLVLTAQSETDTETVVTDRWSEQAEFSHAAEIVEPNPVFETGTVLERQAYFTRLSPVLEGTYSYSHGDDTLRTVTTDLQLVMQSTRDGAVIWQRTEPLNTTDQTVEGDESATSSWRFNISAAETQLAQIEQQLGASIGTTELVVVADVVTTAEDGRTTRHTERFEVDPDGASFSVSPPETYRQEYETTAERTVETGVSVSRAVAGILFVLTGLSGLVILGTAVHRGTLSVPPADRRRIAYERERAEFDDWITTASLSSEFDDRTVVEVDSLEGLVDVAIDTNHRVIEDRTSKTLWVQTPTTAYRHDPRGGAGRDPGWEDGTAQAVSLGAVTSDGAGTSSATDAEAETSGSGGSEQTNGSDGRERFPD